MRLDPRHPDLESAPPERPLRLWSASVLAVIAVIALETALGLSGVDARGTLERITREKGERLTRGKAAGDVWIFGDSQSFSIQPARAAAALPGEGLRALNAAWPFAGWEVYDYALRAALRDRPAPQWLVASIPPAGFGLPPEALLLSGERENRVRLFTLIPPGALLPELTADGRLKLALACLARACRPPSMREREAVKRLLRFAPPAEPTPEEAAMLRQFRTTGAFRLFPGDVRPPDGMLEDYERAMGGLHPRDDVPLEVYERFLEHAAQRGVPVILLNPPVSQTLYDRLEETGALAAQRRAVDAWRVRFPNLIVVEPIAEGWPDELFGDLGHFDVQGDARFQKVFPQRLRRALAAHAASALHPAPSAP